MHSSGVYYFIDFIVCSLFRIRHSDGVTNYIFSDCVFVCFLVFSFVHFIQLIEMDGEKSNRANI